MNKKKKEKRAHPRDWVSTLRKSVEVDMFLPKVHQPIGDRRTCGNCRTFWWFRWEILDRNILLILALPGAAEAGVSWSHAARDQPSKIEPCHRAMDHHKSLVARVHYCRLSYPNPFRDRRRFDSAATNPVSRSTTSSLCSACRNSETNCTYALTIKCASFMCE